MVILEAGASAEVQSGLWDEVEMGDGDGDGRGESGGEAVGDR